MTPFKRSRETSQASAKQGVPLNDEVVDLVQRSLGGDQSAMTSLVRQFRNQVFGLCYRLLGHRQDAEDMTQESFARALRSLKNWDSTREFRPWLLAIAGNRCRSMLSARVRHGKQLFDEESIPSRDPDRREARQLVEEVQRALVLLRDEYRQAFLLFHAEHKNYAEIAEIVGRPVGTVKTWIHRARQELAAILRARGVVDEAPDDLRRVRSSA